MIALMAGIILVGIGAIMAVGGLAWAVVSLWEIVYGPGKPDPYDYNAPVGGPYTDENGNRTGLGVTYP